MDFHFANLSFGQKEFFSSLAEMDRTAEPLENGDRIPIELAGVFDHPSWSIWWCLSKVVTNRNLNHVSIRRTCFGGCFLCKGIFWGESLESIYPPPPRIPVCKFYTQKIVSRHPGGFSGYTLGSTNIAGWENPTMNEPMWLSYWKTWWVFQPATVDGQNPAPPRMIIIPLFIGF